MQNKIKRLFLCCGMMLSVSALADTADELSRIEAETLLLKAHQKQLEVQAQIVTKKSEIASKQAEANRLTGSAAPGDPVIRSVEGIGKTVYTTLQLDNGNTVDVKAGDILPNGMRIISVRPNEVIVETKRKKLIRLGTGTIPPTPYSTNYTNAGMNFPPVPLMPPTRGLGP